MHPNKYLVILNPTAGMGKAGKRLGELEALLRERGMVHEIRLTTGPWHAAEMAMSAGKEGFHAIMAAGGDGTVNEVVNGIMEGASRGGPIPVMGCLCVGRGNDFAYGADIPHDLGRVLDLALAGSCRPMDVGHVKGGNFPEGRFFANGIGIGFDTIVGLEAAKMTHVHGFMTYVFGALKTIMAFPDAPMVEFGYDGGMIRQNCQQISVMNGKRMGGTFFMAPDASNHDGLFDFCVAERVSRREMVKLITLLIKGKQAEHPKIKMGRASRFDIVAPSGGLVCHADGETICVNGERLVVECHAGRIQTVCETRASG